MLVGLARDMGDVVKTAFEAEFPFKQVRIIRDQSSGESMAFEYFR